MRGGREAMVRLSDPISGLNQACGTLQFRPTRKKRFGAARVESGAPIAPRHGRSRSTAVEGTVKTKSITDTAARVSRVELRTEKARVLARLEPGMIQAGSPLRDALATMRAHGGDAVLVVDGNGKLIGILTE